jgi:putative ABC transport system permease protein
VPEQVTAILVGLKNRSAVFSMQRSIAEFEKEALMAILPGVVLDELWDIIGIGERGLQAMGVLVSFVSLAGLIAVMSAGLDQRRRELSILRALGAGLRQVAFLLALEGVLVTVYGLLVGIALWALAIVALGDLFALHFGLALQLKSFSAYEWGLLGAIFISGLIASLIPGLRAYRLSLVDGLSPKI